MFNDVKNKTPHRGAFDNINIFLNYCTGTNLLNESLTTEIKSELITSLAESIMFLNALALEIPCPIITGALTPKIGVPPKFS